LVAVLESDSGLAESTQAVEVVAVADAGSDSGLALQTLVKVTCHDAEVVRPVVVRGTIALVPDVGSLAVVEDVEDHLVSVVAAMGP
jgi:hypothetical protein